MASKDFPMHQPQPANKVTLFIPTTVIVLLSPLVNKFECTMYTYTNVEGINKSHVYIICLNLGWSCSVRFIKSIPMVNVAKKKEVKTQSKNIYVSKIT